MEDPKDPRFIGQGLDTWTWLQAKDEAFRREQARQDAVDAALSLDTVFFAAACVRPHAVGLPPGRILRLARRRLRVSQAEAARRAGLTQSRVSEIEARGSDPRWSEIVGLLEALRCRPVFLARATLEFDKAEATVNGCEELDDLRPRRA